MIDVEAELKDLEETRVLGEGYLAGKYKAALAELRAARQQLAERVVS